MNREDLAYIFSGVVVATWVGVLIIGTLSKDYTGISLMTPILMMVGGFLLGYGPKNRNDDDA